MVIVVICVKIVSIDMEEFYKFSVSFVIKIILYRNL